MSTPSRKLRASWKVIGAVAVDLAEDDLWEIEGALARITVQGARYPEEHERQTGR